MVNLLEELSETGVEETFVELRRIQPEGEAIRGADANSPIFDNYASCDECDNCVNCQCFGCYS